MNDAPAAQTDGREKNVLVGDIPVSFQLAAKGTELNIMAVGYGERDQETVYVWRKYEEMTGVNVNWTTVARDKRAEAVHTVLTNKQSIDLIICCKLSASRLIQYGTSGLIIDLAKDDLLKNNAPNC